MPVVVEVMTSGLRNGGAVKELQHSDHSFRVPAAVAHPHQVAAPWREDPGGLRGRRITQGDCERWAGPEMVPRFSMPSRPDVPFSKSASLLGWPGGEAPSGRSSGRSRVGPAPGEATAKVLGPDLTDRPAPRASQVPPFAAASTILRILASLPSAPSKPVGSSGQAAGIGRVTPQAPLPRGSTGRRIDPVGRSADRRRRAEL